MVDPPNLPGERRLSHPPSDRYRVAETGLAREPDGAGSAVRGAAFGGIAGLVGAAAIVVLGGALTVTAGLIVVAAAIGWAVGTLLRGRTRIALTLALIAVALGQAGLWSYALSEGGVLGPLDFLWQVYGGLVPVEFLAAAIAAWIAAR